MGGLGNQDILKQLGKAGQATTISSTPSAHKGETGLGVGYGGDNCMASTVKF